MSELRPPGRESSLDENALRALFAEIEPPAGLEDRWRAKVALRPTDEVQRGGRVALMPGDGVVLRLDQPRRPVASPRARLAAAAIAGIVTAAIVVGVVASNHVPPTQPEPTITETFPNPPSSSLPTSPSVLPPPMSATVPTGPTGSGPAPGSAAGGPGQPGSRPAAPAPNPGNPVAAPARGPLPAGTWPDASNAGVTPGTSLRRQAGDLHVTTPGAIIADLRVDGTVYVEAPDVTLRRVFVAAPDGASAGVRQLSQAPRLKIEDSEIFGGGNAVQQEAAGLTVQRSDIDGGAVVVTSDATIVDSFLHMAGSQLANTTAARLVVRHNTISGSLDVSDGRGPVTDVTIEDNRLDFIWAPAGAGSRDIRVVSNQFNGNGGSPVSGWNSQAPGNRWTGNVWAATGAPANP